MNYAIIRKCDKNMNIFHPIAIEKFVFEDKNIFFISAKYRFLSKPAIFFKKPIKILETDTSECRPIIEFLLNHCSSVTICASAEKTLDVLKICVCRDIKVFIPYDNPYIVSKALELWGITLFVSEYVTSDLLLYFDGNMPTYSQNTFAADFSDKYVHNKINAAHLKNISFKEYAALNKIIENLKITGIYEQAKSSTRQ